MQLTKINGRYELMLPEHRAARPEWKIENGGWEVKRIDAMLQRITMNDVVFDIGTEEGDISAILEKYTGCKMVLIEPNKKVWPCIKSIWDWNQLDPPQSCYSGFFANEDLTPPDDPISWSQINTDNIIPAHGFEELHDLGNFIARKKLDTYCNETGIFPDIITMDVEGSEFEVLKGAENILRARMPVVFMSVHPVFMWEHYKHEVGVMLRWMHDIGYTHRVIELDYHELHVVFEPHKR
jgi:FkbM family methyltransferase